MSQTEYTIPRTGQNIAALLDLVEDLDKRVPAFTAIVETAATITSPGIYWVRATSTFYEKTQQGGGEPQIGSGVLRCRADGRLYCYDYEAETLEQLVTRRQVALPGVINAMQFDWDSSNSTVEDWVGAVPEEYRVHGAMVTFPVQNEQVTVAPHWETWQYVGGWLSGNEPGPVTNLAWCDSTNWRKVLGTATGGSASAGGGAGSDVSAS